MEIELHISSNQKNKACKAVKYAISLLSGDWTILLDILKENAFTFEDVNIKNSEDILVGLQEEFSYLQENYHEETIKNIASYSNIVKIIENTKGRDIIILNENECDDLAHCLDVVSRLYAGQWDEILALYNRFEYDGNNSFLEVRNKLSKDYRKLGHGSFGIYSKEVSNDMRIMYDIFKVIMYEKGAGGVYAYKPKKTSSEPLPVIIYPKISYLFESEKGLLDFLDTEKEKLRKFADSDDFYIQTGEYTFQKINFGDTIIKRYNGNIEIVCKN